MKGKLGRRLVPALMVTLVAACGGDGGSGPDPVASVAVSTPTNAITVGQTVTLTATVQDANGNPVGGQSVTWSSSNNAVATVTPAGAVTGVSAGSATITATASNRSGSTTITVSAPSSIAISTVSPTQLQPGQPATITGEGFSPSASSNIVTIGGDRVIVNSATATSLQITVPTGLCIPSGPASVVVSVGSQVSAPFQSSVQNTTAPLNLPVGQFTLLDSPSALCLRFAATSANEAYAFGVQSISPSVTSLTPVRVNAVTSSGAAGASLLSSFRAPSGISGLSLQTILASPDQQRWSRHRAIERRLRLEDRALFPAARTAARERRSGQGLEADQAAAIPANVMVGDTVPIRVPTLGNTCTAYTEIRTVVRVIGQRGIWLDDVANPAGGFTLADFQSLSTRFDNQIYQTDVDWFGQPSDFDGNTRIVIVVTKSVNNQDNAPLGFVTAADMVPRTGASVVCPSSDYGEIYYGRAADPNNVVGGDNYESYSVETARLDAIQLLSHEFTHIIQFGRRILSPTAVTFQTIWELEGQATLGEEVNGHAASGRTHGQNYGFTVAWTGVPNSQGIPSDIPYYVDQWIDIAVYFGLDFAENDFTHVGTAPEQCSWLDTERNGNNGPCEQGREVYGVPWSFLRWLTDQFATTTSAQQAFHKALVDDDNNGFTTIQTVTGEPINRLLGQWSASLWLDDRHIGMDARVTQPSWNYYNVIDQSLIDEAHLQPRARVFSPFTDNVQVRGGSTAYFTIGGANRPATYIAMRRPDGSNLPNNMQAWVVRTR